MNETENTTPFFFILFMFFLILSIPVFLFVIFPYINRFSAEERFNRFVNTECIKGNEVAILIKRQRIRYYNYNDYFLARSAINGNKNAIKALNLDGMEKYNDKYNEYKNFK